MKPLLPDQEHLRIDREVERERKERHLHDDARAHLAVDEEFRLKDARENLNSGTPRRPR